MAQHFLLSAEARTLSLASIFKAGEDAAYATFCRMRWTETEGAPVCPCCGSLKSYDVKGRRKFKCAGCAHQFSVNHSEAYVTEEANTNQAESYFSRLRRMVGGQHHHVSARYLHQYACEAAWKEDNRRLPNGAAFSRTVTLAMASPVSRAWKGYWARS